MAPQSCKGFSTPAKRDYTLTLKHGGLTRTALVHIPPGYDGSKAASLVFNLHGQLHYASMHATMSHLDEEADKRDVVTVTPQGTGGLMSGWNVGKSPQDYVWAKVDDVGFIKALLAELEQTVCIDKRRVFCTGFSLGGSLCYRLSCDWSDGIAAIASVSGPDGTETCNPKRAVPLLHFHGTADSFATFKASSAYGGINKGAEFYVMNHAKRSGCHPPDPGDPHQGQGLLQDLQRLQERRGGHPVRRAGRRPHLARRRRLAAGRRREQGHQRVADDPGLLREAPALD